MNISIKLVVLASAAFFYTGMTTAAARSSNTAHEIARQLQELRGQVKQAIVFAAPKNFSFRRLMAEKDLPTISCSYVLENTSLNSLLELLASAEFIDDQTPERDLNVKLGIYLQKRDGTAAKLIFEQPFTYEQGEVLQTGDARGMYNGLPVVAKNPFEQRVRDLIQPLSPTKKNFYCDLERK